MAKSKIKSERQSLAPSTKTTSTKAKATNDLANSKQHKPKDSVKKAQNRQASHSGSGNNTTYINKLRKQDPDCKEVKSFNAVMKAKRLRKKQKRRRAQLETNRVGGDNDDDDLDSHH